MLIDNKSDLPTPLRQFRSMADADFIGVPLAAIHDCVQLHSEMSLAEVDKLLDSPYAEARLGAAQMLRHKASGNHLTDAERKELYDLYLRRLDQFDHWLLVEIVSSAVVGKYLVDKPRDPLYSLARSSNRWRRLTAINATFQLVLVAHEVDDALRIAKILLDDVDEHIKESVGNALRFVGKVDQDRLVEFVHAHAATMPWATFRKATEQLPAELRASLPT